MVGTNSMISHEEPTVAVVELPTHSIGEGIGRIDNPMYVDEDEFSQFTPLLKTKIVNGNVPGLWCRPIMVDDLEDRFVIFPYGGWSIRWKPEIC
jgi:hypothetical protein